MEFEKYVIEVGVRSIRYLSETATGYKLTDKLQQAEQLFNAPCLKDKQIKIRKLICRLVE